jgi:AcrR family transcriptional regulator
MPRRVRLREPNNEPSGAGDQVRRQWVGKWKVWAVGQLPTDTSTSVKVQLRADVERALSRYHPDDEEVEVRDVVSSIVEETQARLTTKVEDLLHEVAKQLVVAQASAYLKTAFAKFPRGPVAAMLERPGSSSAALTARLERYLDRHVKGDEDEGDLQRRVDAWVARRLAEQPPASQGSVGKTLTAVGVAATTGLAAYQHPAVKAAVDQGLAKARELIRQWKTPPPEEPKPAGPRDPA